MARAHVHRPKADGTCAGCGKEVAVVTYDELVLAWAGHSLTCTNCRGHAEGIFARARATRNGQ